MLNFPILSILISLPLISTFVILLINRLDKNYDKKIKEIGLWSCIINLFISLILLNNFDKTESNFQFIENYELISDLNIYYHLGIDGISLPFILLTTILVPVCIIISL